MSPSVRFLLLCSSLLLLLAPHRLAAQSGSIDPEILKAMALDPDSLLPVLVIFDDRRVFTDAEIATSGMTKNQRQTWVAQEIAAYAEAQAAAVLDLFATAEANGQADRVNHIEIGYAVEALADSATVAAVAAQPEVRHVKLLRQIPGHEFAATGSETALAPLSGAFTRVGAPLVEWGVNRVNAPEVWNMGMRGQGVLVAVIDDGFDREHPDLEGQLWSGVLPNGDTLWYDFNQNSIPDPGEHLIYHGWNALDNHHHPAELAHGTQSAGPLSCYTRVRWNRASTRFTLDTSRLAADRYLVRVEVKGGAETARLVRRITVLR